MKSLLLLDLVLILILGSGNPAILHVTKADGNATAAISTANSSSPVTLKPRNVNSTMPGTFPTTAVTAMPSSAVTRQPSTVNSTVLITSTTKKSAGVGKTTVSPGPWKVTTFVLSGLSAVLFLALVAAVLVLCKMRTRLGQASKTLYPITPSQEDHEYLDIEEDVKQNKKGIKVELTHMTVHNEEEFDSPTISPTPPEKPKRKPPSIPDRSEAPEVPSRTKGKLTKTKLLNKNIQSTLPGGREERELNKNLGGSKPNASKSGVTNSGFVDDEANQRTGNGMSSEKSSTSDISLYKEEDELYERYENASSSGLSAGLLAIGGMGEDGFDIQRPYEDPVKATSESNQILSRQGSSSGLPDLQLHKVSSKEGLQAVPLQVANEEADDIEDFGALDTASGLPNITGMQHFDEDEFFDDPEKITTPEINGEINEITDDTSHFSDDRDKMSERSASSTEESLDNLLTYDDVDMIVADDDEPGCYEDFEQSSKSEGNVDIPALSMEQTSRRSFTHRSRSKTEESSGDTEQDLFPKVPPRRDLLRKSSEGGNVVGSFDEIVLAGANHQGSNQLSENEVQLRPGRQVSVQGQAKPRDSYYLFMDDKTMEMRENNTKELNTTGTIDLSGLSLLRNMSGTSQLSVDLRGITDTGTELNSRSDIGYSEDASDERLGSENEMHMNGSIPNIDDSD